MVFFSIDLVAIFNDAATDDEDYDDDDSDDDDDDLYIIGAVCLSPTKKLTSSLIFSATVAGEIYI